LLLLLRPAAPSNTNGFDVVVVVVVVVAVVADVVEVVVEDSTPICDGQNR
jgi:hypothetical protein